MKRVYEWPKTYTRSGAFILKDERYSFFVYRAVCIKKLSWEFQHAYCV
jgi:hypothetical protein